MRLYSNRAPDIGLVPKLTKVHPRKGYSSYHTRVRAGFQRTGLDYLYLDASLAKGHAVLYSAVPYCMVDWENDSNFIPHEGGYEEKDLPLEDHAGVETLEVTGCDGTVHRLKHDIGAPCLKLVATCFESCLGDKDLFAWCCMSSKAT